MNCGYCMNLQGEFEGLNLTSIFQLLCNDQKTGLLIVKSNEKESKVYFNKGTIVYASSSVKTSRLGFIMKEDGVITAKQLKECLYRAQEKRQSIGKTLVEGGYISVAILKKYHNQQVEDIIYNLLFWKKGTFEYKDTKLNLKSIILAELNPMKLVLEASRRMDEMSVLAKVITSEDSVFKLCSSMKSKEELKLNSDEWKVVSLIDGSRTVRQIIDMSSYDDFKVYKILYSVKSYGVIEPEESVAKSSDSKGDYKGIINLFDDILQSIKVGIEDELGDRTSILLEECKDKLGSRSQMILINYNPNNIKDENVKEITKIIENIESFGKESDLLIRAFCEYSFIILKKAKEILGAQPLDNILEDIEKVIGLVKKYQDESNEMDKIVQEMEKIFKQILK